MDVHPATYPIIGIFITGYLVITEKDRRKFKYSINHTLALIIITLLLTTTLIFPIAGAQTITSKELIDSQYGKLGHYLNFGDRLYQVTYSDGTQKKIFERTSFFSSFAKATIVEGGSDTISVSEGRAVPVNIRIAGINLPLFCGDACNTTGAITRHKIEIYDDTVTLVGIWTVNAGIPVPNVKATTATFMIPGQSAGKKSFRIKECVITFDNSSCIYGTDSQSSMTLFNIIWTATIATNTTPTPTATPATNITPTPILSTVPIEVWVDSVPPLVNIEMDGVSLGTTPVNISISQSDGSKRLNLAIAGYTTKSTTITAESDSPTIVILEKESEPEPEHPTDSSSPSSASVSGSDVVQALNETESTSTSHETTAFKTELNDLQIVIIIGVLVIIAAFIYTNVRTLRPRKRMKPKK